VSEAYRLPISVVIPAYNRAAVMPRALASVRAQRPCAPAEVVVVDDGSADDTAGVAERAGARVVRLRSNQGQAVARNAGVQAATQPWIAFLDSDDEWLPHHLATLWPLRDGHVLLGASALHCRDDASRNRIVSPLTRSTRVLASPSELLHPHNFLTTSTTLVRREPLLQSGGFRAHLGVVEDLDMWVRLLEEGTAAVSPEVTIVYHIEGVRISDDLPLTRAGHTSVAHAYADRAWWTQGLVRRWEGASAWDEVREELERGRRLQAVRRGLWLVCRPARVRGALELLAWRFRGRRASGRVNPDGTPSTAILVGREASVRAVLRLVRRPTARALVDSTAASIATRLVGITPVDVRRVAVDKLVGKPQCGGR